MERGLFLKSLITVIAAPFVFKKAIAGDKKEFGFKELDTLCDAQVYSKLPNDIYIYCHSTVEYNKKLAFLKIPPQKGITYENLSKHPSIFLPYSKIHYGRFIIYFIDLEKMETIK